jgi:hypothetical protein
MRMISILLAVAACGAPAEPAAIARAIVLDADRSGAIVLVAGPDEYRGIARDGSIAWRLPVDRVRPRPRRCRGRCPDASFADPRSRRSWQESADGVHALAIAGGHAQWFARGVPLGAPVAVRSRASCVAPRGDRAFLIGDAPLVLHRDGRVERSTGLGYASACAFADGGLIAAEHWLSSSHGRRTRLVVIDGDGAERWRAELDGEAAVLADPTSPRVAYLDGTTLHELDVDGAVRRRLRGVAGARYADDGSLVVVQTSGATRWLTR